MCVYGTHTQYQVLDLNSKHFLFESLYNLVHSFMEIVTWLDNIQAFKEMIRIEMTCAKRLMSNAQSAAAQGKCAWPTVFPNFC